MSTPPRPTKRKLDPNAPISPPPLRRKMQSTTTQTAVASFFTPSSKKPLDQMTWQERAPNDDTPNTLLVGKFVSGEGHAQSEDGGISRGGTKKKIAVFDFDSTLIQTSSGKRFSSNAQDWKWWHASVPGRLQKLYLEEGFRVVVISNQAGITLKSGPKISKTQNSKLGSFKSKVSAVFGQLGIPLNIYAATEKDIYRKPRTGMWTELLQDFNLHQSDELDLQNSIFVGDAGGRHAEPGKPKDFSCSDRNFAENIGIRFYTPEEFFLSEAPRPFSRPFSPSQYLIDSSSTIERYEKKSKQDIVLLCGSPGAGKSTFYWTQLEHLGYIRINQDNLKTRERCLKVADEYLEKGKSVAIDNTNADIEVRSKWIQLAAKHSVPVRCVLLTAGSQLCEHNDAVRALNDKMNPERRTILPSMAFRGFASRYQQPQLSEGFQDLTEVAFKFNGSDAEREIWTQYWT